MQDKINLSKVNLGDSGAPAVFKGSFPVSFNRHFNADIEAACESGAYDYVAVSPAVFKEGTLKAGGVGDIEYSQSFAIDLDGAGHAGRPDVKISVPELAKSVEVLFPNTSAICYQSKGGNGAHVWFPFSTKLYDADVRLDYMVMIFAVFHNSEWKELLDKGAVTQERKMYIKKGREPIVVHGEYIDTTERYYESNEARDAIYEPMKEYHNAKADAIRKKKESAKKKETKEADDFTPHNKGMLDLLRDMTSEGLIGGVDKKAKWLNVDAAKWENPSSNPQWSIPKDCKQVNKFGKANTKEFNSINEFVLSIIEAYNKGRSQFNAPLLSKTADERIRKAAVKIDEAANPTAKKKTDKTKKTEAGSFMKSNERMIRDIIIVNFKSVLDKAGAMLYRVESTGTYKNTYYCIQDKGYSNVIFGGGKGGKMKFIDIFGSAEWDRMVEEIKIGILVMKDYNNDRDVANTAASGMIINKENTTAELVREVLLSQAEQFESAVEAIMDGINIHIVETCRKQKIKSVFDIKRNNSLYWCPKNKRLECWMDEYKLFDNNFNNIPPCATEKIYSNDDNSFKKELRDASSLIDMAVVNDIISDLDKYIKNNPRLMTGGKWQGIFLAGMPMTAIMSSYLGLTKARPVVGVKGTMGMGKSYIVDFLLSVMGEDFGTKRSGQISEAALRREASASGILAVDDNMADDKHKAKIFQHIIKTSFDGSNIVKCSMSADAGGKLEEFALNSMLLFSGTFIPSDVRDGNSEAESRTTIMTVEKDNAEDVDVAYNMKAGLPIATAKNENDDKRTQAFRFYMISKVGDYIVNYERVQKVYNKYAGVNKMNNANRRSDISAAMVAGYMTLFSKEMADAELIELFCEYSNAADSISKNDNFVYDFFTNAIRIGSDSKSVRDDEKEDDDKNVYIDRKNESVAVGMSIYEFATDDKCTPEVAKLFADYGVYKGSKSAASNAVMDTLFIKDGGAIFKAKTLTGEELAVGVDPNIARSNILTKEEFSPTKGTTMIYPYVTADKTMGKKKIKSHISISLDDLEKICGDERQKQAKSVSAADIKDFANNYDDVPF